MDDGHPDTVPLGWDSSALTQYRAYHHLDLPATGLVLVPGSTSEVSLMVRLAVQERVPVIARGGGSGVVEGVFPHPHSLVLDLTHLDAMGPVDATNGHITVGAGVNALRLEQHLNAQGWTLGHWPQSIGQATVGGLVATKSIGQYSTRYGGIEHMVRDLEVVTGTGDILSVGHLSPRRSAGPELLPLFIGSEGTFGIITQVTLKLWPAPEHEQGIALSLPDFEAGIEVMRRWIQSGLSPSVVRLYDPAETARSFASIRDQSLLLAVFHGPQAMTAAAVQEAIRRAPEGMPAEQSLVDHWFQTRNDVSAWVPLLKQGFLVDTIEVAAAWDRLAVLYHTVVDHVTAIPGVLGISGHSSHGYSDGANLYFTFLANPGKPEDGPPLYRRIWSQVMEDSFHHGGTSSHHHGVGRIRPAWVARERAQEMPYLHRIHDLFDPLGLLNGGALWTTFSTGSPNDGDNNSSS